MKKLLLISMLALFVLGTANAQLYRAYNSFLPTGTKVYSDTATNTGTATIGTVQIKPSAGISVVTSCQADFHKLSGTLAGTATLQGSWDNVHWATVTSSNLAITATYTVTDVTDQSKSWLITGAPYYYYRVSWTGVSTMSGTVSLTVLSR